MKIYTTFSSAGWDQFRAGFARLGVEGPSIMTGLLNEGGLALRTRTVAEETKQTGLAYDTVERAQVAIEASPGHLSFTTRVHGGDIRLKFFGAREGGGGVSASPWGRATFYAQAFIMSGRPGARFSSPKLGGQAFMAKDSSGSRRWWRPIKQERSGLFLPDELLKEATLATFEEGAPLILDRILTKLAAMV